MTPTEPSVAPRTRFILIVVALGCAGVECWRYRHGMYPDGVQYVDVARRVEAVGLTGLLNGCWSPLYPLLLAAVWRIGQPSPYWLYPTVQIVTFLDFVIAMIAFDYFLRRVLAFGQRHLSPPDHAALSPTAFTVAAYAVFMIVIGFEINVRTTSPDMLVAAALFAVSGLLLSMESYGWTRARAIVLGALLAAGYLAKTVMFPIGLIYAAGNVALVAEPRARRAATVAALSFVVFALPWLVTLSIWKGRPTFGETGTVMYAWWVNGWDTHLHWIGNPPGSGTPKHPMLQIASHPDAFAFISPAPVTYPPFFDPTYWHEGIQPRFDIPDQIRALKRTSSEFFGILREGFWALGPVLAIVVAGSDRKIWRRLLAYRIVIVPAVLAILLTMLIHVEGRLIAGQLAVLAVALLASVAYAQSRAAEMGKAVAGACVVAAVGTTGMYVAGAALNTARDVYGGESRVRDPTWVVALALHARGLQPGDRIAVVGNVVDVAWAQRASLQIVAEVSGDQLPAYLSADEDTRARVVDAFRTVGVRAVVARSPSTAFDRAPWTRVPDSDFALMTMRDEVSDASR